VSWDVNENHKIISALSWNFASDLNNYAVINNYILTENTATVDVRFKMFRCQISLIIEITMLVSFDVPLPTINFTGTDAKVPLFIKQMHLYCIFLLINEKQGLRVMLL
jgi:hypothetical protein